jgi:hypothetical protein
MGHSTVALRDGRALVVGGISTSDATTDITVAELYDPLTGTFSPTGSMAEIRPLANDSQYPLTVRSPAVALPDGRVLVAGLSCQEVHALRSDGHSDGFSQTQTEQYDPSTGTFSMAAPMPHCVETATTLPNGQVFVTGWWYDAGTADADVEKRWSGLYDPTTGYTRETAAPPGGQYLHLVRLADGHVVVIGDVPDHVEVFQ